MIKNIKMLFLVSLTFVACTKNDDTTTVVNSSDGLALTAGSANFSNYVALGNSLTSGYSDGALFIEGQKGSYPAILSQQFALVGGGDFKIPFMSDNYGGLLLGGTPIQGTRLAILGTNPNGTPIINSLPVTPTTDIINHLAGPFNNMGVPGAKSFHLLAPGYGNIAGVPSGQANPYYVRFASSSTSTVLGDAVAQNPTFFSLWIGNNDVLSYATSGGTGVNQTGNFDPTTYGGNDITDPNVFASVYNTLITQLTAGGAKGVVANIPYVSTIPFFTTVPFNPLTASVIGGGDVPTGQATINALNAQLYGPLNQALTAFGAGSRIGLLSTTSANPLLIKDESLTDLSAQLTAAFTPTFGAATAAFYGNIFGQARQATSSDLVLLSTQSVIGTAPTAANSGLGIAPPSPLNSFGITYPLQDMHVLIPSEIAEIKTATDAYNSAIQSLAASKGLAFVDTNSTLSLLNSGGITANGFTMTSTYVTGNSFSLDGVHPSPRGYALIANKFLEAINAKYGSNLKGVDLGNYRILFPASL